MAYVLLLSPLPLFPLLFPSLPDENKIGLTKVRVWMWQTGQMFPEPTVLSITLHWASLKKKKKTELSEE